MQADRYLVLAAVAAFVACGGQSLDDQGAGGTTGGGTTGGAGGTGGTTGGAGGTTGGAGGTTGGAGGTTGGTTGGSAGAGGSGGLTPQDPDCPLMMPTDGSACELEPILCKYDYSRRCLCGDFDCLTLNPVCQPSTNGGSSFMDDARMAPPAGSSAFGLAGSGSGAPPPPPNWMICTCLESGWYCR